MTSSLHRIKVPVTDEQRQLFSVLHDPDSPEAKSALELLGTVPASDSALLAVIVSRGLADIEQLARRARLDAAYIELAVELAAETAERRVDGQLGLASLTYVLGAVDAT